MRGFCLEVAGDFACFTRPEMKVERVSYDVITPSAARAIFEAIFWKPAIRWHIHKIEVLNPIRWSSVRRNEVANIAGIQSKGLIVEDVRQQRAALLLRDVRYRLYAQFEFIPPERRSPAVNPLPEWLASSDEYDLANETEARPDEKEAKYAAIFDRRATKGQCFTHPYLGCREFSCSYTRLINNDAADEVTPINESRDLGFMLFDLDYSSPNDIKPLFFRAQMEAGTINVPPHTSEEIYR